MRLPKFFTSGFVAFCAAVWPRVTSAIPPSAAFIANSLSEALRVLADAVVDIVPAVSLADALVVLLL